MRLIHSIRKKIGKSAFTVNRQLDPDFTHVELVEMLGGYMRESSMDVLIDAENSLMSDEPVAHT